MANTIYLNNKDSMSMSNGCTDVFLTTIGLSGSRLAVTYGEKRLILWLLERDQWVWGRGIVGFNLAEMPWDIENLESQKQFFCSVINGVLEESGWETLDYKPNKDLLAPQIRSFRRLIGALEVEDIIVGAKKEWLEASENEAWRQGRYVFCSRHGILLTDTGCPACHDMSGNPPL